MKSYDHYAFDADGTLRYCTINGQFCPNQPGEWALMPRVKEKLTAMDWTNKRVSVISNQAGVAAKRLTLSTAYALLHGCLDAIFGPDSRVERTVFLCPHNSNAWCRCRKPHPEMLHWAAAWSFAAQGNTLFVGDLGTDRMTAEAFGCDFMWAHDFFGWSTAERVEVFLQACGQFGTTVADISSYLSGGDASGIPGISDDREVEEALKKMAREGQASYRAAPTPDTMRWFISRQL